MKNELQTLRLFSPLFPHIYPFNEWGDLEDDMVEMDAGELLQYTDEIEALIQKAQHPSEDKHGLAIYIHDESLSRKPRTCFPANKIECKQTGTNTAIDKTTIMSHNKKTKLSFLSKELGLCQRKVSVQKAKL